MCALFAFVKLTPVACGVLCDYPQAFTRLLHTFVSIVKRGVHVLRNVQAMWCLIRKFFVVKLGFVLTVAGSENAKKMWLSVILLCL